jgi:hypothetical protein
MLKTVLAAVLLCALSINAEARPRHRAAEPICDNKDAMRPCAHQPNFLAGVRSIRVTMKRESNLAARRHQTSSIAAPPPRHTTSQVVAHPSGCPARAFCGCGASVRVFGRPIPDLWLAANWLRFPRALPAPGMVAARRGHVFVLESHIGGSTWLAYDANSGRHTTRVHARSIAGFAIVNPHA